MQDLHAHEKTRVFQFTLFTCKDLWLTVTLSIASIASLLSASPLVHGVSELLLTRNVLSGDHIEQAGPGTRDGGFTTVSLRQLSL